MVIHMLAIIILGLTAWTSTRGPGSNQNHVWGMSLASATTESEFYDDNPNSAPTVSMQSAAGTNNSASSDAAAGVTGVIQDSSPVDIRGPAYPRPPS